MTPPLRVAFLDSWLRTRAEGSGSTVAVDGLADGLETLGHRVDRVEPPPGPAPGRFPARLLYNLSLPLRFDASPYDLVVGFDLDGFLLRVEGARHVTALKGIAADEMRFETGATRLRLRLLAALEGRAARRADRVVVTSRYCRRVAVPVYGLDPDRVAVVPEGIDLEAWEEPGGDAGVGASRGREGTAPGTGRRGPDPHPDGAPVLLSVARQYPRKNTETLLRSLPRVRRTVPGVRLRVVGGGPRLPALRETTEELGLADAVEFLGEVEEVRRVRQEYRDADVFVLPSLQEGFGIVFLEAMAAGLPVVAGRAGAAPEVVPHGEAGLLVPPRDPERLASAIAGLARDPGRRRRMGRFGRRHVRRYAWPRVARAFVEAVLPGDR